MGRSWYWNVVHTFALKDIFEYIVDENKAKFGLYMPGTDLKVKDANQLEVDQNTIIVVLAWQYYSQIKVKLIKMGYNPDQVIKPVLP